MKKIFKLTTLVIFSVPFMAVKCGEEPIDPPDVITSVYNISIDSALADSSKYIDLAIEIDSVFFTDPEGTLFNGSGSNGGGTRVISDCKGNKLDVFTSTDREFAYTEIPTGMGPIRGILSEYQGVRQLLLRSIDDVADMTGEKCEEKTTLITVAQFNTLAYEGQLVKLDNVQFVLDDSNYGNGLFNGTTSNAGGSKTLTDCDGNTMIVFTDKSGILSNVEIPTLKGSIIGEASSFSGTGQLVLRSSADYATMVETRCTIGGGTTDECTTAPGTTHLSKDFQDASLTSGGWTTQIVVGTTDWSFDSFSGDSYAKCTNYASSVNTAAETWLISPVVDISAATAPLLSFTNLANFAGTPLKVLISNNYSGTGDPNAATWTDLSGSATWDTDLSAWGSFICSTNIDILAYKSATTYIAFQYIGTDSDGSTWEIDDIMIKEL